jgi:hypothetical protein
MVITTSDECTEEGNLVAMVTDFGCCNLIAKVSLARLFNMEKGDLYKNESGETRKKTKKLVIVAKQLISKE